MCWALPKSATGAEPGRARKIHNLRFNGTANTPTNARERRWPPGLISEHVVYARDGALINRTPYAQGNAADR